MLKHMLFLLGACGMLGRPAYAQSPNNAGVFVIVSDQSGAVVSDAKVAVTHDQTGSVRESLTGTNGSASFPGLSLTGTYTVTVSKSGFGDETRHDITLRSGEMQRSR